jgi:hypothetical protein
LVDVDSVLGRVALVLEQLAHALVLVHVRAFAFGAFAFEFGAFAFAVVLEVDPVFSVDLVVHLLVQ